MLSFKGCIKGCISALIACKSSVVNAIKINSFVAENRWDSPMMFIRAGLHILTAIGQFSCVIKIT